MRAVTLAVRVSTVRLQVGGCHGAIRSMKKGLSGEKSQALCDSPYRHAGEDPPSDRLPDLSIEPGTRSRKYREQCSGVVRVRQRNIPETMLPNVDGSRVREVMYGRSKPYDTIASADIKKSNHARWDHATTVAH